MDKKSEPAFKRFLEIQAKLKANKNQKNNFGGYSYRSCEDILESVKPLMYEYGISIICSDEMVEIGGKNYVVATATAYDTESDWNVYSKSQAREADSKKGMDDSQITGAASSYARKYALNGLLCIDDNKDSDFTNRGDEGSCQSSKPKKPKQRNLNQEISALFKKLSQDQQEGVKSTQKSVKDMSDDEKVEFIEYLNELTSA